MSTYPSRLVAAWIEDKPEDAAESRVRWNELMAMMAGVKDAALGMDLLGGMRSRGIDSRTRPGDAYETGWDWGYAEHYFCVRPPPGVSESARPYLDPSGGVTCLDRSGGIATSLEDVCGCNYPRGSGGFCRRCGGAIHPFWGYRALAQDSRTGTLHGRTTDMDQSNDVNVNSILKSFEHGGWTLVSDCGPCVYFVHEDGRETKTFYPEDMNAGWPRYAEEGFFDLCLIALASLAHASKPDAEQAPTQSLPGWSGVVVRDP